MGSQKKPRRRRRLALADCRRGSHRYGSPRSIGGGITRQTCSVCGAVSIDLSQADTPISPPNPATPRHIRQ